MRGRWAQWGREARAEAGCSGYVLRARQEGKGAGTKKEQLARAALCVCVVCLVTARRPNKSLLDDFSYNAGTYCSAAFTNSEAESFFDSDWCDQGDSHCDVISRHAHLCTFR